jgi:hypothetical protein
MGDFFPFVASAQSSQVAIKVWLTCQPGRFAVLSDLPNKRLTLATRRGQCKLAGQGNFANQFIHSWQKPVNVSSCKASPEESTCRTYRS